MAITICKNKIDNKQTKYFQKVKLSHLLMGRVKLLLKFIRGK